MSPKVGYPVLSRYHQNKGYHKTPGWWQDAPGDSANQCSSYLLKRIKSSSVR